MSIKPGRESSEYWNALRAELLGFLIILGGVAQSLMFDGQRALVGLALAAIGAFILVKTNEAYAATRGAVKAAAVRRPADNAPRGI